jgi:hypothetical protein
VGDAGGRVRAVACAKAEQYESFDYTIGAHHA